MRYRGSVDVAVHRVERFGETAQDLVGHRLNALERVVGWNPSLRRDNREHRTPDQITTSIPSGFLSSLLSHGGGAGSWLVLAATRRDEATGMWQAGYFDEEAKSHGIKVSPRSAASIAAAT